MGKAKPDPVRDQVKQFFRDNPYRVFTAGQIAHRTKLDKAEIERVLGALAGRRFVQRIWYPQADIYRYVPPPSAKRK